ncbi:Patatin group A-3 [Hordeum vulgare]|nr:Patatin group A-3 [Hordeum vulgare]
MHADAMRDEPASQDIIVGDGEFFVQNPVDYGKFMIVSIGCGLNPKESYSAKDTAKWGILNWIVKDVTTPIVDMFNAASADMVDIHLSVLFGALRSSHRYLRIQYDQLSGSAGSIDDCSKENMDRLVQIGGELLRKNVSRVDLETGRNVEMPGQGTNAEQLAKFAKHLSDERRRRQKTSYPALIPTLLSSRTTQSLLAEPVVDVPSRVEVVCSGKQWMVTDGRLVDARDKVFRLAWHQGGRNRGDHGAGMPQSALCAAPLTAEPPRAVNRCPTLVLSADEVPGSCVAPPEPSGSPEKATVAPGQAPPRAAQWASTTVVIRKPLMAPDPSHRSPDLLHHRTPTPRQPARRPCSSGKPEPCRFGRARQRSSLAYIRHCPNPS